MTIKQLLSDYNRLEAHKQQLKHQLTTLQTEFTFDTMPMTETYDFDDLKQGITKHFELEQEKLIHRMRRLAKSQ